MSRLEVVHDTDTPEGRLLKVLERVDDFDSIIILAIDKQREPWIFHSETRMSTLAWLSMIFQRYVLDTIA